MLARNKLLSTERTNTIFQYLSVNHRFYKSQNIFGGKCSQNILSEFLYIQVNQLYVPLWQSFEIWHFNSPFHVTYIRTYVQKYIEYHSLFPFIVIFFSFDIDVTRHVDLLLVHVFPFDTQANSKYTFCCLKNLFLLYYNKSPQTRNLFASTQLSTGIFYYTVISVMRRVGFQ